MTKLLTIAIAICSFLLPSSILADTVPDNSHYVEGCSKIINLNEFPEITIIGHITGPMISGDELELKLFENNECLSYGYKFNQIDLYSAKKSYIDSVGLKNIKVEKVPTDGECTGGCSTSKINDPELTLLGSRSDKTLEFPAGYYSNFDPTVEKNIEYTLAKNIDGELYIYKSKQITKYSNGSPEKIETFDSNNKVTNVSGGGFYDILRNKYWIAITVGALLVILIIFLIVRRRKNKL